MLFRASSLLSVMGVVAFWSTASAQDAWDHLYDIPPPDLDPMIGMDRDEGSRTGDDYDGRYHADGPCQLGIAEELGSKIERLLSANGMCGLLTPARYEAFKQEVPQAQHYAVNYVAWIAGEPLLPADEAADVDAQYLG